jgi:hypothetical protein
VSSLHPLRSSVTAVRLLLSDFGLVPFIVCSTSCNFEQIKPGTRIRGLSADGLAEVVQVNRFGADALNVVFRSNGRVNERLVYRGEEIAFEVVESGRSFPLDADGGLLRLARRRTASGLHTCSILT